LVAVFKQIGDLDNAVEAFKNAVSWQLMLATCQELDYSDYDLQTAAQEMADLLANLSRYREVPFPSPHLVRVCDIMSECLVRACAGRRLSSMSGTPTIRKRPS
jgi:hypothetical protein